jgi:hypothetical protein
MKFVDFCQQTDRIQTLSREQKVRPPLAIPQLGFKRFCILAADTKQLLEISVKRMQLSAHA